MDRPEPVAEQPQDTVEQDGAAASEPRQESESGVMNRLFRTVGGWFNGTQDGDGGADQEQTDAEPKATDPPTLTLTQAELDERVARQAQSLKDRELARERWDHALSRADADFPDFGPLQELAAKGDRRAERELARRGATAELGEARGKAVAYEETNDAERERLAVIAGGFDAALLEPVLQALPEKERDAILGDGIAGLDGRQAAVTKAIAAIRRTAQKETAAKLLGDEAFVRDLLGDSAFRRELLKNPVTNKQLRSFFRGELDEPDLNPGSGPGARTEGENAEMNQAFRAAYLGAVERGEDERGASTRTGGRGGARRGHADLLDDDE